MDNQKVVTTAERVKAGAITFIGGAFVVYGCTYFMPQHEYYVLRILLPVFNLLGPIALAVGMVLLGLALIWYGWRKWRKQGGRSWIIAAIVAATVVIFMFLNSISGTDSRSDRSAEEIHSEMEQERSSSIEKVKNVDRPQFDSKEAEGYFDELEQLILLHRKHVNSGEVEAVAKDREAFNALLLTSPKAIEALSNDDKYLFSQYNAKLLIEWSEIK